MASIHTWEVIMEGTIKLRRLREWAKLVLEAENSGNKTVWCQQNGIRYRKYLYWQKHVRDYLIEHGDHSLDDIAPALPAGPQGSHDLVDITARINGAAEAINSSFTQNSDSGSASCPEVMIQVNGCQIYVGSSVSEQTLQTVLKVVRNA